MKKLLLILTTICIVTTISCKKETPVIKPPDTILSDEKVVISFAFLKKDNPALEADIITTIADLKIPVDLPGNITERNLIATFGISAKASVTVNGIEQVSGQTKNDFTAPVIYTVKAENKSTVAYTLTLKASGILPNMAINNTTSFYAYTQNHLYLNLATVMPNTPVHGPYFVDAYNARAYADYDKDGDMDIMAASFNFTSNIGIDVEYFKNAGNSFQKDQSVFGGAAARYVHARKAITGDFDKNGWPDVVIAGHGFDIPPFPGEKAYIMLNTNGKFISKELPFGAGFYHSVCAGDIDNDGDQDLFFTLAYQSVGKFLINDGNGNFTYNASLFPASLAGKNFYTSELYDINKDGYLDLVNTGHEYEGANSIILWGNHTGKYSVDRMVILPKVNGNGAAIDIDFIDYDKNGQTDIVLTRTGDNTGSLAFYTGYFIQIIKNTNSTFTDVTSSVMPQNANPAAPKWVNWLRIHDINNDGWPDITADDKLYNLEWRNNNGVFIKL